MEFKSIHTFAHLENDCEFTVTDDELEASFKLINSEGNKIKVVERVEKLSNYLVGINIISCEDTGKKKESRRCNSCKYFNIIHNYKKVKGYCIKGKRKGIIYGSNIICSFDYDRL